MGRSKNMGSYYRGREGQTGRTQWKEEEKKKTKEKDGGEQ